MTLPDVIAAEEVDAVVARLQGELDELEGEYTRLRADLDRCAAHGPDAVLDLILRQGEDERQRALRDASAEAVVRVQDAEHEADRIVAAALGGLGASGQHRVRRPPTAVPALVEVPSRPTRRTTPVFQRHAVTEPLPVVSPPAVAEPEPAAHARAAPVLGPDRPDHAFWDESRESLTAPRAKPLVPLDIVLPVLALVLLMVVVLSWIG